MESRHEDSLMVDIDRYEHGVWGHPGDTGRHRSDDLSKRVPAAFPHHGVALAGQSLVRPAFKGSIGEYGIRRGKQNAAFGPDDRDGQAGMPHQRIVEQLRNLIQVASGLYLGQDTAHEFDLAGELVQILLLEMTLHRSADKITDRQKHCGRNRREEQSQTKRDRSGPHYADSATSRT